MRIGSDYPKIRWETNDWVFLEPNALIGDVLLFSVSIYFGYLIYQRKESRFYLWWSRFFFCFGIAFLCGGFGHFLFEYTGIIGKYPSWYLGMVATFCIERAMVELQAENLRATWKKIATVKLVLGILLESYLLIGLGTDDDVTKGLIVPTWFTIIGLGFALGYLGYTYQKNIDNSFKWLFWSVLILLPSALFQGLKINLHPWFDRNDVSHVLLIVSLIMYYRGIKNWNGKTLALNT
jgi:hypothetical protein